MSIIRRLGASSAIYGASNLLQKGAAFLLMPLYTLYLDPDAYGVLAVVTSVNGLLGIAFTLSLTSAVTRFYFEYQDDPQTLAEFWGTILSFTILLSIVLAGVLLWVGRAILAPLIGDVPFWPYVALGVLATVVQPFFATFLTVLQTRNEAGRYALISLGHFAVLTGLTIGLVVMLGWGVTGALLAMLIAAALFFVISIWLLRKDVRLCLKWRHLRDALAYSVPQLPHTIASQVTAVTDRLVLNARLGTAAAGLYSVGAMLAMVVEVAAQSVNRAYVPLSMDALKRRSPHDLAQLRSLGALIVACFCLLAVALAAFARELVWLLAAPAFARAAVVVPILAFAGVASAMYYLFVSVLFYERGATKLIPIGTLTAAALNVILALLLIPRLGLIGAAAATLVAQAVATVLVAAIASKFDPVQWDYGRYASAFCVSLACALSINALALPSVVVALLAKLAWLAALILFLGALFWQRPLILARAALRVVRCRFGDAAELFDTAKVAA